MSQKQGVTPGVRMNPYQRAPTNSSSAFANANKAPMPGVRTNPYQRAPANMSSKLELNVPEQKELPAPVETKPYVSAFSRTPSKPKLQAPVETKVEKPVYGTSPALQAHIANLNESASVAYKAKEEPKQSRSEVQSKKNAFAIIHFGKNPVYLELELYFFKMLRQYTNNDILYLYSVNDTPDSFVDAVRPLVTSVVPYDDNGITFNVKFSSGYTNFNTLRTCNFIFAYTLDQYDTVCIIESDMVIMKPIDPIFDLKSPAATTYHIGDGNLKTNMPVSTNPSQVLAICKERNGIGINGGVMLIKPSKKLFETYKTKIPDIVKHECKYPNETLFEYVNHQYYNLPVQYNLSHYKAKSNNLQQYGLKASDIVVYHFNETKYKHLDIIKNPMDENGDNWIDIIQKDKKYEVKKLPIMHYKTTIYDKYRGEIESLLENLEKPSKKERSPVSSKKNEIRPISPLPKRERSPVSSKKNEIRPISPLSVKSSSKSKSSSNSSSSSTKTKKPKCPKGTRRSKKTGNCEPYTKQPKCPKGTRRNKKTGNCEPK